MFSINFDEGNYVYDIIKLDFEEKMWMGGNFLGNDIASGYMSLVFSGEEKDLSNELKTEIERVTSRIISGEIRIKSVDVD